MSRVTYSTDADAQAEEPSLNWRKSSLCPNNATCVEVAALPGGGNAMRDGKNPTGPQLAFGTTEWVEFLTAARAGEFAPGA
jgi:hypothetical protein